MMQTFEQIVRHVYEGTETRQVVAELDAEWFRQHPKCQSRIREYVPGEFDSDSGGVAGDLSLAHDYYLVHVTGGGCVKTLMQVGTIGSERWAEGGLLR